MTYSGSSPIMGQGSASAAQIQQWFVTHNPNAPEGLGDAVIAECQPAGVNSDLVAAQIAHETGYWTSQIANQKNNPAGIGAENDNPLGKAITFPTPQAGIHAQVAHLLTYVLGAANPLKADDPRYHAAQSAGYLGVAHTLNDLDGRWAVPGDGYGAAIARLANELVGTVVAAPSTPTQADIGYPVTVRWARDQGPARQISDIAWFIVHDTEGGAWPGDAQYLLAPSGTTASAHAVIGPNGELWFEVPLTITAWTPGNDDVAVRSINVELSGHASEGFTEDQYRSLAAFFRWCVKQGCTFPPKYVGKEDVPGICGHQDVADPNHPGQWGGASHHTDPGPKFDWAHLEALIAGDPIPATPPTPNNPALPTPDMQAWTDPATNCRVVGGMLARFKQVQAALASITPGEVLLVIGHPTGNERVDPDGVTRQNFEHVTLTWKAHQSPDRFDILEETINPYQGGH